MNTTTILQETVFEGLGFDLKADPILVGGFQQTYSQEKITIERGRKWCCFALFANAIRFIPRYVQTICKVVDAIFCLFSIDPEDKIQKISVRAELKASTKDLLFAPFRLLHTLGQLSWGLYDPDIAIEYTDQKQF